MTNQKEPNIGVSFQARIKYKGGMVRGFRENTNTYFVYKPYSRTKGHRYSELLGNSITKLLASMNQVSFFYTG